MIAPTAHQRKTILARTPRAKNLEVCPHCQQVVLPKLFVYRREPDHTECPRCHHTLRSFENSSRNGDKILARALFAQLSDLSSTSAIHSAPPGAKSPSSFAANGAGPFCTISHTRSAFSSSSRITSAAPRSARNRALAYW